MKYKSIEIMRRFHENVGDFAFKHGRVKSADTRWMNLWQETYEYRDDGGIEVERIYEDRCGNREYETAIITQEQVLQFMAQLIEDVNGN